MRRRRGQLTRAEQLLRLILMHVAGGLSLEQTVTRAQACGLATLNAMALHKRLCTSRQWLEALTAHLLAGIKPHLRQPQIVALAAGCAFWMPPTYRNRAASWRIHYSLRLPEMCCDFFELTDDHGAGKALAGFRWSQAIWCWSIEVTMTAKPWVKSWNAGAN